MVGFEVGAETESAIHQRVDQSSSGALPPLGRNGEIGDQPIGLRGGGLGDVGDNAIEGDWRETIEKTVRDDGVPLVGGQ